MKKYTICAIIKDE
jgi:hypothetical protein